MSTALLDRPRAAAPVSAGAPAPLFIEASGAPAARAWWQDCRRRGAPYVVVYLRRGWAGLVYDALSLPPAADSLIAEHSLRLAVGALHIFRAHASRSSRAVLSACAGRIWRLDPAEAREAAADLAELLTHAAGGAA